MTIHDPQFPALVSSRICHDLISPVGAIANGIELLEEMSANFPEVSLISQSVANAKIKLQYFRVCFGRVSAGSQLSVSEIIELGNNKIQTSRLSLEWDIGSDPINREEVKLLFLILLCMETALPLGGNSMIRFDGITWNITADSDRIVLDDAWNIFNNSALQNEITPALVQFPLALDQLGNLDKRLVAGKSGTRFSITL